MHTARATRRTAPASPVSTPLLAVMDGVDAAFTLAGVRVRALAEGALWIDRTATLVVSDLHLEKGSAYAAKGQFLPPYDTRATLRRLAALIAARRPRQVVSLGDSFHDIGGPDRMAAEDRAALAALIAQTADWVWIEGNHDPALPPSVGGRCAATLQIEALTLQHEPDCAIGTVAGHLHPCAKVAARGRAVRARCFATDGARLVMPAFGAFTGGLNVCDAAFAPMFPDGLSALILGRARVHPAAFARLLPDS